MKDFFSVFRKIGRLSSKSDTVVESFHKQVSEMDTINNEIMTEVGIIDSKITDLTLAKEKLIDMHEKNARVQGQIQQLIS